MCSCTELSACPVPAPWNPGNMESTGVKSWFRISCIGLGHAVHDLYLFILPMLTKQLVWQ